MSLKKRHPFIIFFAIDNVKSTVITFWNNKRVKKMPPSLIRCMRASKLLTLNGLNIPSFEH
jgi:hypothetical protein